MAEAVQRRSRPRPRRPEQDRHGEERGLRGLVGAGPSQVGLSGAMRARDAARPTEADEAAAKRDLRLVRRNYVPPASGPSGSSRERS
jgi:hypothetical protein